MKMIDKFLSGRGNIIKAAYSAVMGVFFQLAFRLASDFFAQLAFIFVCAVAFCIPMIINMQIIRNYKIKSIRKFILWDLLFTFLPAVIGCVLAEMVYIAAAEVNDLSKGMGSLIFIFISLLLTLLFWFGYFLLYTYYKRIDRNDN